MNPNHKYFTLLTATLILNGCGTINNPQNKHHVLWKETELYGGIAINSLTIKDTISHNQDYTLASLYILDMPVSLVADTALVPIKAASVINEGIMHSIRNYQKGDRQQAMLSKK